MSASAASPPTFSSQPFVVIATLPFRIAHAAISAPSFLFLALLAAMLFRPPDLKSFPYDRVLFIALLGSTALRLCVQRERLRSYAATWPMLGLLLLGFWGVVSQPYDASAWSLLMAKWIVPVALFHLAGHVFRDERSLGWLETFLLWTLVYLAAVSVLFLLNFRSLIFPQFILDEGIGIHADRARGPLLQAVATGVCLNILGIFSIDAYRRRRVRGPFAAALFVAVPLALLATKTRAVWLSAAISAVGLACLGGRRVRRVAVAVCVFSALGVGALFLYRANSGELGDRLQDRSPVDFRTEMYSAGWQMFIEKPWTGWGNDATVQPEVGRRIYNFRLDYFVFHNTYLELAVQRGVLGLGLYAWLFLCLFRLRKAGSTGDEPRFLDSQFRKLWPAILVVYLLNASAVVMNYQFVNGLLFSIAGLLSERNPQTTA